ncbi:hypothetical protein [Vreelandella maris]|uniref:hypothetical protein n=1 Tax=Vreelandella maris TaxID=2729617 RepID=UPI0030EC5EC0|tara:strand:+ start:559 stop:735 length:177 start_codon:yes stop_codon:yes gene_type:complete
MAEHQNYEPWLEELNALAEEGGIDLKLDKYHYHTWFMRGWAPESVIDDIRETVASSDR